MRKSIYKLEVVNGEFRREAALKRFHAIYKVGKQSGELIRSMIKLGASTDSADCFRVKEIVRRWRGGLGDCWTEKRVFLRRTDMKDLYVRVYDDLKAAAYELREKVKNIRRNRRENHYSPTYIHKSFGFWMNKQIEKTYHALSQGKMPKTDDKYIGIEIECIVPVDSDLKALMLPFVKYVSLARDGSIDVSDYQESGECDCENPDDCNNSHNSATHEDQEIRVLVKESELTEVLTGVCRVLNQVGAVVNKSCGLHVHFDMRNTTEAYRAEAYAKLFRALPLLMKIVPESRRNNQYCKKNGRSVPNYNGSRYRMINPTSYYKHNTFEIRLFNSTTNAEKILNWIHLLQGIMKGAIILRSPSVWKHAARYWNMSPELLAWAEARQAKFAGSSTQDSNEVPALVEVSSTIEITTAIAA